MGRLSLGVLSLVLLSASVLAGCLDGNGSDDGEGGGEIPGIQPQEPPVAAPSFTVMTIDGEEVSLNELEGRVVMIYFMGLGCSSCAANLPDHKRLWDSHGEDPRFAMLALNSWAAQGVPGETEEDMRAYRDEKGVGWDLAIPESETLQAYGVRSTPTHFFIDHEGLVQSTGGRIAYDSLATQVDRLVADVPA